MQTDRLLDQFPLFQALSYDERTRLQAQMERVTFRRGQFVYHQNQTANYVYFVLSGMIKIGSTFSDGREIVKGIVYMHDVFGEEGLIGQSHRKDFSVVISKDVHCLRIQAEQLTQWLLQHPLLSSRVMQSIVRRLQQLESRLESFVLLNARDRIIHFLRDSATNYGTRIGIDELLVKHALTQSDIASLTGTSRQTVTAVMNDLKKNNIIRFNRRSILFRDMQALA